MDAPAILQWDSEEKRNPYAWYLYVNGSAAHQWNLRAGTLVDVWGIGEQPSQWGDDGRISLVLKHSTAPTATLGQDNTEGRLEFNTCF